MRRGPSSLLLATLAHGAVLVVLLAVPRRAERAARWIESKKAEIEVELLAALEPPAVAGAVPEALEPERVDAPRSVIARVSAKSAPRIAPLRDEPSESTAAPDEPQPVPQEDGRGALPPGFRAPPVNLLGSRVGANPLLASFSAAEERADRGVERAIRSTLRERDRKLGLGVSGPVVAAAEEVARTSTAAVESHAMLEVVADGSGKVVSVAVAEASEDFAGWDAVAKGLLAALRAKRLHVAPGSRGVAMTIAIESRESLPSGAAPGVNVTLLGQKVHSGKNERSAAVAILPFAKLPIEVPVPGRPGVTQTKTIVLPVPMPNISGVFDVSDLAAPAARVVHAHATSEREL